MANQPIFILPEGTERYSKRDALRMNITAAKVLSGIVRTTLGPKGMDKMLVNSLGDVTVTNDGATIMREMEINQPAARMLVETAKKQEDIVGDGTTSVVVIAGEVLSKAEELLDDGIATSIVVKGIRNATSKAKNAAFTITSDVPNRKPFLHNATTRIFNIRVTAPIITSLSLLSLKIQYGRAITISQKKRAGTNHIG